MLVRRLLLCLATLSAAALVAVPVASPSDAADNVVLDGNARFTLLSPTLVRLEYSEDGVFEDRPTFNAVNRSMPAPSFTTGVENGQRVIRTDRLTLKYRQGSGPFTRANLSIDLTAGSRAVTARPDFGGVCAHDTGCEAETQALNGNAGHAIDHTGYTGSGFVDGLTTQGAGISWTASGLYAAGDHVVHVRYANGLSDDLQHTTRTLTLTAGGVGRQIQLPKTANWDTWSVVSVPVTLPAGTAPISLACKAGDSCRVNVDSISVTPAGGTHRTPPTPPENLGGWRRSLDNKAGAARTFDGLLTKDGWYVLDDTRTALLNANDTITQRPDHGGKPYQDGYFFGYGHDYRQGLADLRDLTGPAPLLPRWAFGVWYSLYTPYSDLYYRTVLLPAFRANKVPLDVLVVDTDFKGPHPWNGWGWDPLLFPDPQGFVDWTKQQGLQVVLNAHPSIVPYDPKYTQAQETAGGELARGECMYAPLTCRVFDWSDPGQLQAYFDLHDSFERQGVRGWWLDWCCDSSSASAPGITPDTWINAQYANRAEAKGQRGFAFSRLGSALSKRNDASPLYPSGPWADHRYTAHFTGDTTTAWSTLAAQPAFTVGEGNIGVPYVTHDIGGFNGLPLGDLYARWVQFGAFQPITRLHGNHSPRLPWEFPGAPEESAEKFLRLREALIPYTYSLAREAADTGVPMTRGLYLNYPEHPEAYSFKGEYLFGDDVLVAPVTTPGFGNVETKVWFPPGEWTDYFSGRTYVGPSTATVTNDLSTMPVFIRSGGVLPTRTNAVSNDAQAPLDQVTLDVATGGDGSFTLYEDAGEGHGYRSGASARTAIGYAESTRTLTIAARDGSYPGAVPSRTWTLRFRAVDGPATVRVNGSVVASTYDAATRTLTARTSALAAGTPTVVSLG
jgi:hypothetical protein